MNEKCETLTRADRQPYREPIRGQYPGHVIALDQSEAAVTTPGYLRTRRNNEDVVVKGIWFENFF